MSTLMRSMPEASKLRETSYIRRPSLKNVFFQLSLFGSPQKRDIFSQDDLPHDTTELNQDRFFCREKVEMQLLLQSV